MPTEDGLHKIDTDTGDKMAKAAMKKPPFGPGFSMDQIHRADKMETWATLFSHPEEYVMFRLLDSTGNVIAEKRVEGY